MMKSSAYTQKVNFYDSSGGPPGMTRIYLELTRRCNLNCPHCYVNLPANDSGAMGNELSTEKIQTILLEAASLGCIEVIFTGGEPLLRRDFSDIYIFSKKIGFKVVLFTNATLINSRIARLFREFPPKGKVQVTLYGMDEYSCRKVSRRPGAFNAARRGINLLRRHKIPFSLKGILLPDNHPDNLRLIEYAKGIPSMGEKEPEFIFPLHLRARRDNLKKNQEISRLRISKKRQIDYFRSKENELLEDTKKFCSHFIHLPGDTLFKCGAGIDGLCIDPQGYLYPCILMRDPQTQYDLRQGTLEEAITNFFPELRKMKTENPDYLKRCARCFLKNYCEQCPAVSYMETGNLDAPAKYYCDSSHLWASFFGLIKPREKAWKVRDWRRRLKKFIKSGRDLWSESGDKPLSEFDP